MARLNVGQLSGSQMRTRSIFFHWRISSRARRNSGETRASSFARSVGRSVGRFIGGIDIGHGIGHPYRRRELLREAFSKLSYRVARALTATQFLRARWNGARTEENGEQRGMEEEEGGGRNIYIKSAPDQSTSGAQKQIYCTAGY